MQVYCRGRCIFFNAWASSVAITLSQKARSLQVYQALGPTLVLMSDNPLVAKLRAKREVPNNTASEHGRVAFGYETDEAYSVCYNSYLRRAPPADSGV